MTIQLDPLILVIFTIESSAVLSSLIINIYLMLLVLVRGFRFGNYRYFIYVFALLDCTYSIGSAISMYQNHADDKMVIVFSLAPWRENKNLFRASLNLYFFSYIALLVHVTMSSIYRYALLCNKTLRRMFEKKRQIALIFILLCCFFTFYLSSLSEILSEDAELSQHIIVTIQKMYNADLTRVAVVGNTIENISKPSLSGQMAFIVFIGFLFLFISACCGYLIHLTLQGTAISSKTKMAHSKALRLLLAQFALPLLFLHIPTFTFECYTLLIQDTIPMFVRIYIRIFLTYYPVANAMCIIFLTDDFRNYILSLSGGEWKVVTVIVPLSPLVARSPSPAPSETSPSS